MLLLLIVNLPDVILKHIQCYLPYDDTRYFINSNKHHFTTLKQETIYFSLNQEKSRQYVEDKSFQEMILSKVKDGYKQIGLSFEMGYEAPNIHDIVAHKIKFGRCYPHLLKNVSSQSYFLPAEVKEIPFLSVLQDLELGNCVNIKDFSTLSHLKKLELQDASQLTDITPLQHIPHLVFKNCPNIQDFTVLSCKKQTYLSISQSPITDVSFLRNMLKVQLCFCEALVDVSPLNGVRDLVLMNCSNIRDISGLGNHYRLTIANCPIERGYECFRTVRHANISTEVSDLSVFQEVKSLQITFHNSMERQLFLLKDIPDLIILSSFFNIKEEVYDIKDLRNTKLTLHRGIIKIRNNVCLPSQLRHLEIITCDQIDRIIHEGNTSIFRHLQCLHLTRCLMEHVNGLGDIPNVILQACIKLRDISGLGRNRSVELLYCSNFHDVSSLATVPIVTISNCDGIIDYSSLSKVPRLKIISKRTIIR